jgi:predicted  nucleic acid-binding Zn-ribbon protein
MEMSTALGLFRLQQIDSHIDQIEAQLVRIRELLQDDSEIRTAMEQVNLAETKHRGAEHSRQISEEEAREKLIKIQQAESNLYGGSVQNPKELLDLQADVAFLKKHLAQIEDQELEAMLKVESTQAELQSVLEDLKRVQTRLDDEKNKLMAEKDSLSHNVADLQSERTATISQIESGYLKTYETLRLQRRGIAVAEVSENACRACGTTLNAALQQSARHASELVYCPSCGRILYAG